MPVTFRSLPSVSSASDSLRSQEFLTPPTTPKSAKDIPFKPEKPDDISLSMKRSRSHRHGRHANAGHKKIARQRRNRGFGIRRRSHSLRKTLSLPSVQPRFDLGTVELLQSPQRRTRRWTVPFKASSTQGLATPVPVDVNAGTTDPSSARRFNSNRSPAMITLRRATTARSRRHATLTSFPPPRFTRHSSGLLSTFLNSITGHDEGVSNDDTEADRTMQVTQKPRATPNVSKQDMRPSTSSTAPPVQTEVVTVGPQPSYSAPNQAAEPVRRYSTRYVSDNGVYEIIWDENCSLSSSDGELPSPNGQASLVQNRDLIGAETLERRLSKALSQSRRDSLQEDWRNKPSYVPSSTLSMQSIWTNPKIARLFREPVSGSLPHSKNFKYVKMAPSSSTDVNVGVDLKRGALTGASTNGVEFFPPLRSRANTNGSGESKAPWTMGFKDV
ncbi:uncharacterized protein Z520_03350 [Fonsecaea multimorphosa CBS 102226]|uniref:Uncharacterized protein n=1 Tax=Fonsecaea multimorphosa CBS 102226 TaxID=1442371 RepID=A0A0D2KC54_9EURO|nr:uncharacterized protein Z520_03350 [Fonsecaea multimorphosa CBS 102226]KIY00685.1 hypothetical protein Z520_03350 [Fonsecaea multimorphosa CBS 102226]OAL27967.1 hypothetical protein AYO22_03182 [Fonsecaea multimorphosa]